MSDQKVILKKEPLPQPVTTKECVVKGDVLIITEATVTTLDKEQHKNNLQRRIDYLKKQIDSLTEELKEID